IRAEDTVTQSTEGVFVHEGGSVTLSCNYTTSDTTAELFWYIQRQSDSPKYMMRENTYGKGHTAPEFKRRFTALSPLQERMTLNQISSIFNS
uniref:Immunoglobulin V-set domain-containing protein n=1 Tax=Scleropages formosus TaxID=113540 RepID=A0A8C9WS32_SCLFO